MKFLNLLILVLPARFALAATYNLVDNILGTAFLTTFNFQAISDPTHGRVNYVDASTAQRLNLTYAAGDTFILRADSKTVLDPNGPGRNSVRIQSKKTYTTHVSVYNIRHMPQGCGTWPAVWENGPNWPNGGEVDVLEGVNDKGPNQVTPGCSMPVLHRTPAQNDCNVAVNSNAGCGVKMTDSRSYGPAFNNNGGGWFAADVKNGQTVVNTGSWGTPSAYFPNTQCDIASHFKAHNIIINLTFCGDWAGSAYSSSGCPSSCVDFVNKNPGSFSNAFFDFASLRVYT